MWEFESPSVRHLVECDNGSRPVPKIGGPRGLAGSSPASTAIERP